ncbi:MAG: hypothetical protein AAF830_03825 [Pseudomonadota bacterium]
MGRVSYIVRMLLLAWLVVGPAHAAAHELEHLDEIPHGDEECCVLVMGERADGSPLPEPTHVDRPDPDALPLVQETPRIIGLVSAAHDARGPPGKL